MKMKVIDKIKMAIAMRRPEKILSKLHSSFSMLKYAYNLAKQNRESLYRIDEIDMTTNKVIIHSRTRTTIKTTLEEALSEVMIVEGLLPMQACWLGYYYAKCSAISDLKNNKKTREVHYKLRFKRGRFKVISFDQRTAMLVYLDTQINKLYQESVTSVAQDTWVINNTDPSQACYIGMLAGYEVVHHGTEVLTKNSSRPLLRIVK